MSNDIYIYIYIYIYRERERERERGKERERKIEKGERRKGERDMATDYYKERNK